MKFMIHYGDPSRREPEVVEASRLVDHGHEDRWIDFLDGNDDLVLRIRAADVERVEHVRGEDPAARNEGPDLSRVLA
jgi:hypothetical protein